MSCLYSITEVYQLKAPISDSTSFVIDDITPETLRKEELTNLIILDDEEEGKEIPIQASPSPVQASSNPVFSTPIQANSNPILSTPSQANSNPVFYTPSQANSNPILSTHSSSSPKQDRNENQQEYEPSTSDYFNYQPLLSQMMSRRVPTETTTYITILKIIINRTTTSFRFVKTQDEF